MILSDRDILAAMTRVSDALVIDPPVGDGCVQPASLDVSLGSQASWHRRCPVPDDWMTPTTWDIEEFTLPPQGGLLYPGVFILATTEETVHIPTDMCAQLSGKSSLARIGLEIHRTAGFIDPGFRGQITLEMTNVSPVPITLTAGMKIGQLVFFQLSSPAQRPYGSDGLNSHYQDQVGTTRSYMETSR